MQCTQKMRLGQVCKHPSVLGGIKCKYHKPVEYGLLPTDPDLHSVFGARDGNRGRPSNKRALPTKEQMGFYAKHIGPKLTELLNDALAIQAFDISEEIGIIRASLITQVEQFSGLNELRNDPATAPKTDEAILQYNTLYNMAAESLRQGMNAITFQVERQAKIHNMVAEKIHPNAINDVVRQINRMVHEVFGQDHWELVERFDQKLTDELQLPSLKNQGTTITPDQEVTLMDASVPLYVEEVEFSQ